MDFLKAGGKIAHLHKDELTHELLIRKLPINTDARRHSLVQALKQTADLTRRGSLKGSLVETNTSSELSICERKIEEIEAEIGDDLSSAAAIRLKSRSKYLLCRLSRLPEDLEEVKPLKATLRTILERLEGDKDSVSSSSDSEENMFEECAPVTREIVYKTEKSFNINSLNLKFKGDTCVRTFLTRLEELRVARQIPEGRIFRSFPEILDGPALSWFRSNRVNFSSYSEVTRALKDDFDIPDLDFKLLQEIRARTQAKNETIVSFVSTVLGMFERLNKEVSEADKLDILTRNIRPEYSRELALQDISSVSQLKSLCKRIELMKVRADQFREPSSSIVNTSYTDTSSKPVGKEQYRRNFIPKHTTNVSTKSYVAAVAQPVSKQPCFRCGLTNHPTRMCRKSRELVCFKCGEKGVRVPECPKCTINTPKN